MKTRNPIAANLKSNRPQTIQSKKQQLTEEALDELAQEDKDRLQDL